MERCQFMVARKGRSCRMLVKAGRKYCGEHAGADGSTDRIVCPLDPKHTVQAKNLQKHLSKCNSKLDTGRAYVRPGINQGDQDCGGVQQDNDQLSLGQLDAAELRRIMEKVEEVWSEVTMNVEEGFLEHQCMRDALQSKVYGVETKKHLKQQSSILGHAHKLRLLDGADGPVCYVEFGAGRAKLSYWLAEAVRGSSTSPDPCYLLIERSGQRYKFENKLAGGGCGRFDRIRCAIEHVDLRLVDCVRKCGQCVAFCKHLCGSGTDAALRCLVNATAVGGDPGPIRMAGALLAPCCHHRCGWGTFTGRDILTELGFTPHEFKVLTGMSSWATCGLADDGEDRKWIGRKCKLLLNYARGKYLEGTGRFDVQFVYYVKEEVTPENLLIIVRPVVQDENA